MAKLKIRPYTTVQIERAQEDGEFALRRICGQIQIAQNTVTHALGAARIDYAVLLEAMEQLDLLEARKERLNVVLDGLFPDRRR